ncbi:MAG TPA: hypothetical protein VJN67_13155 [Stellaceae bacterium]|nr:hypothetical protein [Stellaceae bacterium]
MAAKSGRGRFTVKHAYRDKKRSIRIISLAPGASTGRHPETKDYIVIPLTDGTICLEIYRMLRGKEHRTEEIRKLKKHQGYQRKVGRGCHINLTNCGKNQIHIFKD